MKRVSNFTHLTTLALIIMLCQGVLSNREWLQQDMAERAGATVEKESVVHGEKMLTLLNERDDGESRLVGSLQAASHSE